MPRRRPHGIHVPVVYPPCLPGQLGPPSPLPALPIFTPKQVIHGIR